MFDFWWHLSITLMALSCLIFKVSRKLCEKHGLIEIFIATSPFTLFLDIFTRNLGLNGTFSRWFWMEITHGNRFVLPVVYYYLHNLLLIAIKQIILRSPNVKKIFQKNFLHFWFSLLFIEDSILFVKKFLKNSKDHFWK